MENDELEKILPQMNVTVPPKEEVADNLVPDEMILGMFSELMNNYREDRSEIKQMAANFADMVFNDGDATSASKEALVNLLKAQVDTTTGMSKIADLVTRIKLKEKDTFPRYLAAHQNNTIHIGKNTETREMIRELQKLKKRKEEGNAN